MDRDLFTIAKTDTYTSLDGSRRTFYAAGDEIPADEARMNGALADAKSKEMQERIQKAQAAGGEEVEEEAPATRSKGAAPENRSQ